MSTFTAELSGTQRGQPRQQQPAPKPVAVFVTDCQGAGCGRPIPVPVGAAPPYLCQRCLDKARRTPQQADADELARVDALTREQFRDWSTPELEEYVSVADRELGGYHAFCHDAATAELDRRRQAFDADFMRYSMLESGCGDFAGMTDAEVTSAVRALGVDEDEIARVESGDLDPYDMRDVNDV